MATWTRCSFALCIFLTVWDYSMSQNSQCTEVYDTQQFCVIDNEEVVISCPDRYVVEVIVASLRTMQPGSTCPPEDPAMACTDVTSVIQSVARQCTFDQTCTFTIDDAVDGCQYEGGKVIEITYACQPQFGANNTDIAFALPMTRDVRWTGSLTQIDSHFFALNGTLVQSIDTKCMIAVPANTEFRLKMIVNFWNQRLNNPRCSQHLTVSDEDDVEQTFCDLSEPVSILGCHDEERHYDIRFHNSNPAVGSIFVFWARVHQDINLVIECGKPLNWTFAGPQFTSSSDSSENNVSEAPFYFDLPDETVETEQEGANDLQNDGITELYQNSVLDTKLPIILGCIGAAVLIMVLVLLIVLIRYRKEADLKGSDTDSETDSNYHNLGNVYVDGEMKSKLVMSKIGGTLPKLSMEKI